MPKYLDQNKATITDNLLFEILERRGRKKIVINRTKNFKDLQGYEFDIMAEHEWSSTDKLFKLSQRYYGTMDYWWVIGLVNNKPTDANCKIGDVLLIPKNPNGIVGVAK